MLLKTRVLYDIAGDPREIDEEAKEWEHKLLQNSMDKELHELNRRLEEKEVSFTCHLCTRISFWHTEIDYCP